MATLLRLSHIGRFRQKFFLTRKRLASLLDVDVSTLYRWEKEDKSPDPEFQLRLDDLRTLFLSDPHWRYHPDADIRTAAYLPSSKVKLSIPPPVLPTAPAPGRGRGYTLSRRVDSGRTMLGVTKWRLYAPNSGDPGHQHHQHLLDGPPDKPPYAAVYYSFLDDGEERRLHEWRNGALVPTRRLDKHWNVEPEPDPDVVDLAEIGGDGPAPEPAPKPNPDGSYDIEDDWEPPSSG
jgi:DNA-binding XRE family transcriptional regulator